MLTTLWLLALSFYAISSWEKIAKLEPNAVGDLLAGAFAPLAFAWLVVAVFLQRSELQAQRKELEQNREALLLQAGELKNSVAQLAKQTELFTSERLDAQRVGLEDKIEKELQLLAKFCLSNLESTFWIAVPPQSHNPPHRVGLFPAVSLLNYREAEQPDEAFRFLREQFSHFIQQTQAQYDESYAVKRSNNMDDLSEAIRRADAILDLSSQVQGSPTETHVKNLGLVHLRDQLATIMERLSKLPAH